ncbi:protein of unknown function [Legionella micdadei]|uniref:Uncharacterized protein n=1 Tax=Legionella micdadei TaxID=451 RepID=A0A098GHL6_LEGMI|nr:protein of unknown function [Legionella micdadei]
MQLLILFRTLVSCHQSLYKESIVGLKTVRKMPIGLPFDLHYIGGSLMFMGRRQQSSQGSSITIHQDFQ